METHLTPSECDSGLSGTAGLLGQKWMPRDKKCVASTRRFVRDIAADWNAAEDIPDIVELLVSEVVTNALVHGVPNGSEGAGNPPAPGTIRIAVVRDGPLMTVDVRDPGVLAPRMRSADHLETSGRGLAIVASLADEWGWNHRHDGKSVWFRLAAWPGRRPSDGGPRIAAATVSTYHRS